MGVSGGVPMKATEFVATAHGSRAGRSLLLAELVAELHGGEAVSTGTVLMNHMVSSATGLGSRAGRSSMRTLCLHAVSYTAVAAPGALASTTRSAASRSMVDAAATGSAGAARDAFPAAFCGVPSGHTRINGAATIVA